MPGVGGLPHEAVREAVRLLGQPDPPGSRSRAMRTLRDALTAPSAVRSLLADAPSGAEDAFVRLAAEGPATVEDLLGRGWWGHGALPPPLDWLQRRALITVVDGLVHALDEAREGFLDLTLHLDMTSRHSEESLLVQDAACVVVAPTPTALQRALVVGGAGLRAVSPTVAVSPRSAAVVNAALRGAGVSLTDDLAVPVDDAAPALPGSVEDALGPRAVRTVLARAVRERRQVWLRYFASSRGGAATERTVDAWSFDDDLLRGWCHLRKGERTFAVDRVGLARLLPSPIQHHRPGVEPGRR